ncbi:hypothetical protein JTE90_010394 [Oedothorax gibbosus]|uniref:INO80 complex subunit E N-terminal domain-containing protein n=1 Tax=Oedothorax gibbosus TaxID=931172 RepID=A0AAV6W4Z2_9ARAC|nr:hypothetical protein JTE90_010394 [Oedothorax gibbosus]
MPPKVMESQSYRLKYLNLKKKFKALLYENESFQEELRKSQRKLLRISRDKSFLLDRIMKFENVESSTTDSDATVSSDTDGEFHAQIHVMKKCPPHNRNIPVKTGKNPVRKKAQSHADNQEAVSSNASVNNIANEVKKKKSRKAATPKAVAKIKTEPSLHPISDIPILHRTSCLPSAASVAETPKPTSVKIEPLSIGLGDGHMTSEEIERHLDAKQSLRDLMPEKTPLTLPIEIFSNDPLEIECLIK